MRTNSKLSVILALCAACTGGGGGAVDASVATTSYMRDIQPILERSCVSCHSSGGIAPFALDTYEAAQPMAATMWSAIDSKRMPPFFASADCNSYEGDYRLGDAEKTLFKTWVDEGGPRGTDAEAVHAQIPAPETVRHDIEMGFGEFDTKVEGQTDNYRCYMLDPKNTTDQLITGYEFMVGNIAVMHHMLAYAVEPGDIATVQALDDADPGPGYECTQGGVGVPKAIQAQVAGWVPGSSATRLPLGTGLMLKANTRIIMQLHYNTAALYRGGSSIDASKLALELVAPSSLTTAQVLPMLKFNLDIKANDASSVQTGELPARLFAGENGTIYRAMGHMHQLGTAVRTDIVHSDGTTQCLLDIRGWDFNWQRDYTLKTPITLKTGDKLRITCTYDNSAPNQAYLNGVQQQPRDVAWGESSFDEMCMTYMTFVKR